VTSAFVRDLDALQLPYLYRDFDHQWKVLNGPIGQEILKKHEASNFIGSGGLRQARATSTRKAGQNSG